MSIPRSYTTIVDYDRAEGTRDNGNGEGEAQPSRITSPGNGRRPPPVPKFSNLEHHRHQYQEDDSRSNHLNLHRTK